MLAAAEKFFQSPHALPTMPEVAGKLLKSFDDDNISMATLAALIGKDPALAAKVLRLANSARYSPSHQIDPCRTPPPPWAWRPCAISRWRPA